MDTAVEIAGAMESPAHVATAEGELTLDSRLGYENTLHSTFIKTVGLAIYPSHRLS